MNTVKQVSIARRRGVLLLVVLSTLIVFLLLGTLLLTQATRSRTAARAFAEVNASSASNGALAREVLDEALMQLVRGGTGTQASAVESVLGDKYGVKDAANPSANDPIQARASVIDDEPTAGDKSLLQVNIGDPVNGVTINSPLELNGRLLTFLPTSSQASSPSTYRILRVSTLAGGGYQLFLANQSSEPGVTLPTAPCDIVINGPEYRTESHDSYAGDNWLTQLSFSDAVPTTVRPAFVDPSTFNEGNPYDWSLDNDGDGQNDSVDNDGDGVPDGIWRPAAWRDEVLPNRIATDGTEYQFDVSYLVLDLDSRVNLNIHGPMVRPPANAWDWANAPSGTTPGFGWGVCDVDSAALFKNYGTNDLSANVAQYLDSSDVSTGAVASGTRDYRASPYIGNVDGRFGQGGAILLDSTTSDIRNLLFGNIPVIDMQGLMKVFAVPGSGTQGTTLKYAKPSLSPDPYGSSRDPYLTRLDSSAPRLNVRNTSNGVSVSPFSLTELERILRHFDADANALPQRLAGLLEADAQRARLFLTTDSWDTPALTGNLAQGLLDEFSSWATPTTEFGAPYDVVSPDLASGTRFDINRPFRGTGENPALPADAAKIEARKQEYCKHLFTLLYAIDNSLGAADVAQWVANVVDYRDSDSNMTRFTFDDDPSDGWDPPSPGDGDWDAKTVWGNERTELVIAQTLAWTDNPGDNSALYVMFYRPPLETIKNPGGSETPAIMPDPALTDSYGNLDLAKLNGNGDPIWRLKYNHESGVDRFVRFDGGPFDETTTSGSLNTSGENQTSLQPDHYLLVRPGPDLSSLPDASESGYKQDAKGVMVSNDNADKLGICSVGSGNGYAAGRGPRLGPTELNSVEKEVLLQRLANATLPHQPDPESSGYNPYVTASAFPYKPIARNGSDNSKNWKWFTRVNPDNPNQFWKTPEGFYNPHPTAQPPALSELSPTNRDLLLWPNRPFISQVELAMVPPGSGDEVLEKYRVPGTANYHYLNDVLGSDVNARALLEATIVPSRIYGSSVHYSDPASLRSVGFGTAVDAFGTNRTDENGNAFAVVPFNQLSQGREPGRVNLNLLWADANAVAPYSNHGGWLAMLGQTVTDDVAEGFNAKTRLASMFDLKGQGGLYVDGDPASVGSQEHLYPLFAYKTAIKLGNVGTIRSNVFAVWITLRVTNTQTLAQTYHRLFAVVDRSIPVAFAPGQDLNAANTIRLKRYIN